MLKWQDSHHLSLATAAPRICSFLIQCHLPSEHPGFLLEGDLKNQDLLVGSKYWGEIQRGTPDSSTELPRASWI